MKLDFRTAADLLSCAVRVNRGCGLSPLLSKQELVFVSFFLFSYMDSVREVLKSEYLVRSKNCVT